ncbi:MAG: hypothetical protein QNJ30_02855 [Kiloniellales bacterium]|nr:hypothetical protein [Kiloniellales bacterium]
MAVRQTIFLTALVPALAIAALAVGPSERSLAEENGWQRTLSADIEFEHGCEVAYLSQVVEREVDGELMVMAKVHCVDQRAFDAIRMRSADAFEFKECTLREKQSC